MQTKTAAHPTSIDLSASIREQMVSLLNRSLADTTDLYTQARHAHWNVKGESFIALHELFDQIVGRLAENGDLIAERAVALGGTAEGTARQVTERSSLGEYDLTAVDGAQHVRALAKQTAKLAASTRQAIQKATDAGDLTTADLYTEISRGLDKDLWFLEAHLQGR